MNPLYFVYLLSDNTSRRHIHTATEMAAHNARVFKCNARCEESRRCRDHSADAGKMAGEVADAKKMLRDAASDLDERALMNEQDPKP